MFIIVISILLLITIIITLLLFLSLYYYILLGIDDWNEGDIVFWFMNNKITVPKDFSEKLKKYSIDTGIEALTLTKEKLETIGLSKENIMKYEKVSKEKLASVSSNPVDFFEWRVAHRQLCDYWITPVLFNSNFGLIWARFFSEKHSPVIDKVNDPIDGTSLPVFFLTWFICPTYPFFQMSKNFKSNSTYIDEILYWILALKCLDDLVKFLILFDSKSRLKSLL